MDFCSSGKVQLEARGLQQLIQRKHRLVIQVWQQPRKHKLTILSNGECVHVKAGERREQGSENQEQVCACVCERGPCIAPSFGQRPKAHALPPTTCGKKKGDGDDTQVVLVIQSQRWWKRRSQRRRQAEEEKVGVECSKEREILDPLKTREKGK